MPRPSRRHSPDHGPADLTHPEMDALHHYMQGCLGQIESFDMLDGMFTAMHLLPEPLEPAAGYAEIFGVSDMLEELRRLDQAEQSGYLDLILRHWVAVEARLLYGGEWLPPVSDAPGNREADWARGFELGFDEVELWWETRSRVVSLDLCFPSLRHLLQDDELPLRTAPPRLTDNQRARLMHEAVREIGRMYQEIRWKD